MPACLARVRVRVEVRVRVGVRVWVRVWLRVWVRVRVRVRAESGTVTYLLATSSSSDAPPITHSTW